MKKLKLLTLSFAGLLGITSCGGEIIHVVDQELTNELPSSVVTIKFWHCLGIEKTKNLEKVIEENKHFLLNLSVLRSFLTLEQRHRCQQ